MSPPIPNLSWLGNRFPSHDNTSLLLYIKLRVDFLIEEKKKIIENEKREYEELEKKRVEYERLEQEKVENERRFKEKVENEKRERERLERHKLEDKKRAKIMAKAFIGIIIAFIIYFSYDQLIIRAIISKSRNKSQ